MPPSAALSMALPSHPPPPPTDPTRPPRKLKPSPQPNHWSRARAIRSGTDHVQKTLTLDRRGPDTDAAGDDWNDYVEAMMGKQIYMVSDGTGWTAVHSVNAALRQFEHCLVDRGCPVNTHLFSGIDDVERLIKMLKLAAKAGAMLVYTLADPSMAESARRACKLWGVPSADVLDSFMEAIAAHWGVCLLVSRGVLMGGTFPLAKSTYWRIEAIEFTIKQDDRALPQNLYKADIVLVGVSRIGKTPLSIYLAQKGSKVANVPIAMGVNLPKTLFEIDPEKVFGLTINPVVLRTIRKARAKTLGYGDEARSNYSEMDYVREELEYAGKIFAQNPSWPVIGYCKRQ